MVRIISSFLLLLSVATIGLATPEKRTVSQALTDIGVISTKVTSPNNAITAFPLTGGSLIAALGIHTSAGAVITSLKTATADVITTGPVNEADGTAILEAVQAFEPAIQHALTEIVIKRPGFVALPVGGLPTLILQDLTFLKGNTTAFSTALIENAPESLVPAATTLKNDVLASFDTVIAAYA